MVGAFPPRHFVGRESELARLRAAYAEAGTGRGALVLVAGEPGIGKTALCAEFAHFVRSQGGTAVTGHSYEAGAGSIPYLPFIEALQSYLRGRESSALEAELGEAAPGLVRLLPELRRVLGPLAPESETADPEEARYQLLDRVASFLRNAATVQESHPLLLILEDLHDADRGTLDLLVHVVRRIDGARLLVVGTYRDIEVNRTHALSMTLADLRRVGEIERIHLHGLTEEELQGLLDTVAGEVVPEELARTVHGYTEGNPLFAQEVGRYITEQGLFQSRNRLSSSAFDRTVLSTVPDGLRDVIGKRLSRLSSECNRVLAVAAVIGREFDLGLLRDVAEIADEALSSTLEEAVRARMLDEQVAPGAVTYRFAHALFRQTLYEELLAPRRLHLHQQIGRAIEARYPASLATFHGALAEHFAQSTVAEDLEKAIHYSEQAARQAVDLYAYGEAERYLAQALRIQEVLDPTDALRRCELLLALGEAILPSEEPGRAATMAAQPAFDLAQATDDPVRAARAAILALDALVRSSGGGARQYASEKYRTPEFQEWADRADRYAVAGTVERLYADVYNGLSRLFVLGPADAHPYLRRAALLALESDDDRAFFMAAGWGLRHMQALQDARTRQSLVDQVLRRRADRARSGDVGICLLQAASHFLGRGDRQAYDQSRQDLADRAAKTRDASVAVHARVSEIAAALLEGRLETALSHWSDTQAFARRVGGALLYSTWPLARAAAYLGRDETADALVANPTTRPSFAYRASILALLGRRDEALAIRKQFGDLSADSDETGTPLLVALLEAATLCGDRATVSALVRRLSPRAQVVAGDAFDYRVSLDRLLGRASALLGDEAQARAHYLRGLELTQAIGFRPEAALLHLDLGELLLREATPAPRSAAVQHLDIAVAELHGMHMQPALAQALVARNQAAAATERARSVRNPNGLSNREMEILRLIAQGASNQDIAAQLALSVRTVERHAVNIYAKIGAHGRLDAATYAYRSGILQPGAEDMPAATT